MLKIFALKHVKIIHFEKTSENLTGKAFIHVKWETVNDRLSKAAFIKYLLQTRQAAKTPYVYNYR